MRAEFLVELSTHGALSVRRSPCGPGLLATHQIVQLGSQSLGGNSEGLGPEYEPKRGNQCSLSTCWSGPVPGAGFAEVLRHSPCPLGSARDSGFHVL